MQARQAAFLVLLLLNASDRLASETQPSKSFSYPVSADFLVIERRSIVPLTPGTDGPWTRIYGDGRVQVHRPSYMKGGGDYQAWLSLADLDALLAKMDKAGLMFFDPEAVEKKYREAERRRLETFGEVPVVSDAGTVRLTIRLESYTLASSIVEKDFLKSISWNALGKAVEWYPEIEELVALAGVNATLRELARRVQLSARHGETLVLLPE